MRALLAAALLAGCQTDPVSTVQLDLRPLLERAALVGVSLDALTVTVTAADMRPMSIAVDPEGGRFDAVVPAGRGRRFEVVGRAAGVPWFWGVTTIDLGARVTIDLVIPAAPAGQLVARLLLQDGRPPSDTAATFSARAPYRDLPAKLTAVSSGGTIDIVLPEDLYEISVEGYELYQPIVPEVRRGTRVAVDVLLVPPQPCDGVTDVDGDLEPCATDCNDRDPRLHNRDADGDRYSPCQGDCDDGDASRSPGAAETLNDGIDSNCNGFDLCWNDGDGDGWGLGTVDITVTCSEPGVATRSGDCDDTDSLLNLDDSDGDGFTSCFGDCDDANPRIHPLRREHCSNGLDDDCDGQMEVAVPSLCGCGDRDGDGDSCGDCNDDDPRQNHMDDDNDGYVTCFWNKQPPDCDDTDANRRPGLREHCGNGIDDDCNGAADMDDVEACFCGDPDMDGTGCGDCAPDDATLHLRDDDRDGYTTCDGDCDDRSSAVYPGKPEDCSDPADNNCDGRADAQDPQCACPDSDQDGYRCDDCNDNDPSCVYGCGLFYPDADLDGYGAGFAVTFGCYRPGLTQNNLDCDDTDASVSPGYAEICNGVDDDCDGRIDNVDRDGDGFAICANAAAGPLDCNDIEAYVVPIDVDGDGTTGCYGAGRDCDDGDPRRNPARPEVCNQIDDDCDGVIDNGPNSDSDSVSDCLDNCPLDDNPPPPQEAPISIDLRFVAADCGQSATYDVQLGGVPIASYTTSPTCTCRGADLLPQLVGPFPWVGDGSDQLVVQRQPGGDGDETLVAVEAYISLPSGTFRACLFGYCDATGACPDQGCPGCASSYTHRILNTQPQPDAGNLPLGDACDCSVGIRRQAYEVCNFIDDDCDGSSDDGSTNCCTDFDGDGYVAGNCGAPAYRLDCYDFDASIRPGALPEAACADGLDNDCDGATDRDDSDCPRDSCPELNDVGAVIAGSRVFEYRYFNHFPCDLTPSLGCSVDAELYRVRLRTYDPFGVGRRLKVCNWSWAAVEINTVDTAAGCAETCLLHLASTRCHTLEHSGTSELHWALRADDGPGCNAPLALEVQYLDTAGPLSNEIDNDQDGTPDDEDLCVDADGDGYGSDGYRSCANGGGWDCDDGHAAANPFGTEVCDFVDNDCSGAVDEGFGSGALLSESFATDPSARGWTATTVSGGASWALAINAQRGPYGSHYFPSPWIGTTGELGGVGPSVIELVSPSFSAVGAAGVGVTFDSFSYNEGGCAHDVESVWYSVDGGSSWLPLGCDPGWLNRAYDGMPRQMGFFLPGADNQPDVRLKFRYDSGGTTLTNDGWYIANVRVYGCALP